MCTLAARGTHFSLSIRRSYSSWENSRCYLPFLFETQTRAPVSVGRPAGEIDKAPSNIPRKLLHTVRSREPEKRYFDWVGNAIVICNHSERRREEGERARGKKVAEQIFLRGSKLLSRRDASRIKIPSLPHFPPMAVDHLLFQPLFVYIALCDEASRAPETP